MTRAPVIAGLGALALLLALIGLEWWGAHEQRAALDAPIVRGPREPDRPAVAAETAAAPELVDQWARIALARPLMSSSRHAAQTGSAVTLANGLPRLTGTLTGGGGRVAIFARDEAGHPVVVREGGTLGPYKISRIVPNEVTLEGPSGVQTLHPRFGAHLADPDPGNDGAPTAPPLTLPGVLPQMPNPGQPFRLQQQLLQQQQQPPVPP